MWIATNKANGQETTLTDQQKDSWQSHPSTKGLFRYAKKEAEVTEPVETLNEAPEPKPTQKEKPATKSGKKSKS